MKNIKIIVFYSLLALISCTVMGQDRLKRPLTNTDYHLWSTLVLKDISNQGNWISYKLQYETAQDTLFVQNTKKKTLFKFPNTLYGKFATEQIFACLTSDKKVLITNLKSGKRNTLLDVESVDFNASEKLMVTVEDFENKQKLCVRELSGSMVLEFTNLIDFKINSSKTKIILTQYINQNFVCSIVNIENKPSAKIILKSNSKINAFKWSSNDAYLAFYEQQPGKSLNIGFYNVTFDTLTLLNQQGMELFTQRAICKSSDIPLQISEDGELIFFGTDLVHFEPSKEPTVALWRATAPYLYPLEQMAEGYNKPYLAVWNTTANSVFSISDSTMSTAIIVNKGLHVLTANPQQYEPQYELFPKMDYFIKEVRTTKSIPFASKLSSKHGAITAAPQGSFIAYYKDKNWWMYAIEKNEHVNLTNAVRVIWDNSEFDPGDELSVYGIAGWSMDNAQVYLYDRYDIWSFACDGSSKKRLTFGREHEKQYRFAATEQEKEKGINLTTKNVLAVVNHQEASNGYVIRSEKGKMKPLAEDQAYISNLKKASEREIYAYSYEKYDVPPTLLVKSGTLPAREVLRTNQQQEDYYWGKSEVLNYQNTEGKQLKATLYYPANYKPEIKYPMVVYIYERLSHLTHQYVNPSIQVGYGFNTSNFTTNGYFVLMPDIEYELGNPGVSAAHCVQSAVQEVIETARIDPLKIGLYGHSFGGYETNFITTQTPLFAAAVSGAGVADTQQHYFTLNSEMLTAEAWRYENQQYRMGFSFYERQDLYLKNSPLINAASISTPLLLWSGAEDENVKPTQSITFFIALKRLGKKCALLIYPKEGHILMGKEAKKDLNDRVLQWFNHYLKKEHSAWITKSTGNQ